LPSDIVVTPLLMLLLTALRRHGASVILLLRCRAGYKSCFLPPAPLERHSATPLLLITIDYCFSIFSLLPLRHADCFAICRCRHTLLPLFFTLMSALRCFRHAYA